MSIKRGDIFYVDLNPTKGSEQAGRRPVIVIQNNVGVGAHENGTKSNQGGSLISMR